MSWGVGNLSISPAWSTGPQVIALNIFTAASVAIVATFSVRLKIRQLTAGLPQTGCTPHLPSLRSQAPRKPLQHQAPRSNVGNDLRSLMLEKSGRVFTASSEASTNLSRAWRFSKEGVSVKRKNTANVRNLSFVRPLRDGSLVSGMNAAK
ncbi:unnamed protein product [Phytophthora lilii]|uniref:Unnamed protein product n=1 Tax=Phytophthora lilii TaxID=2077276 RepID=A0A9W6YI17_9STRA|nr:unnamed protein product [Phytophthora lilii]